VTRRYLITLACFALPFILYWIYDVVQRRRLRATSGSAALARREAWPLTILWLAGAVLAVETFILAALSEHGSSGEGRYVPAQWRDGKIVPPHYVPILPSAPPQPASPPSAPKPMP
jgi:hypothetical protein